jgi:hypothetical protein
MKELYEPLSVKGAIASDRIAGGVLPFFRAIASLAVDSHLG